MKKIAAFISALMLIALPQLSAAESRPQQPAASRQTTELTFAYFPLAVPISVLGETMQRDRILQKNLDKQGIKLVFKPFSKGNDVIPLIREGKIAGVSMADMPAIEAVTSSDIQILGFVKQSYSGIVAPFGTQLKDLRKKRIGNAHGSTSHYALLQALSSVGMSERDVTLVPLGANEMIDALDSGKIDAFAAWEPTPTAALKKHPGKYAQINRQTSYSFFMLSGALIRTNPEVAKEITAALIRSIRWMKKSDANLQTASRWALIGTQNFTGKPSALNAQDIARITTSDLLDIAGAPVIPGKLSRDGSLLLKELEFLKQIGKLPADASRERLAGGFRNSLMQEIMSAPAKYNLNQFEYAQ